MKQRYIYSEGSCGASGCFMIYDLVKTLFHTVKTSVAAHRFPDAVREGQIASLLDYPRLNPVNGATHAHGGSYHPH